MLHCWKAAIFADGAVKGVLAKHGHGMAWHVVHRDVNEKGERRFMGLGLVKGPPRGLPQGPGSVGVVSTTTLPGTFVPTLCLHPLHVPDSDLHLSCECLSC